MRRRQQTIVETDITGLAFGGKGIARIDGLALKHYDGASFSLLRAFKQGMIEAGVQGLTHTLGKEVEAMKLEGYTSFEEELAEEWGVDDSRMLGNFPQAFTHVSLINAAGNLSSSARPAVHRATGEDGMGRTTPVDSFAPKRWAMMSTLARPAPEKPALAKPARTFSLSPPSAAIAWPTSPCSARRRSPARPSRGNRHGPGQPPPAHRGTTREARAHRVRLGAVPRLRRAVFTRWTT